MKRILQFVYSLTSVVHTFSFLNNSPFALVFNFQYWLEFFLSFLLLHHFWRRSVTHSFAVFHNLFSPFLSFFIFQFVQSRTQTHSIINNHQQQLCCEYKCVLFSTHYGKKCSWFARSFVHSFAPFFSSLHSCAHAHFYSLLSTE